MQPQLGEHCCPHDFCRRCGCWAAALVLVALLALADVLHVPPPLLLLLKLVAAATAEEAPRGLADAATDATLRRNLMGGRVRWAGRLLDYAENVACRSENEDVNHVAAKSAKSAVNNGTST